MESSSSLQRVVLAYSGGLDTSCILVWLRQKGYSVIAVMADIGQEEDFEAARAKAMQLGAEKFILEDVKRHFVEDFVWPAVSAGLLYEGRYLLGTSLARPCISEILVQIAKANGATHISHGATGKGNDQVRFELACYSLWPQVKIIAPWRETDFCEKFKGRQDLLRFAAENDIPVPATPKNPWSVDANIMHISYESGVLEDPSSHPPSGLCQMTVEPEVSSNNPMRLQITFNKGVPTGVKNLDLTAPEITGSLEILQFLNLVAGKHGIGCIDIVENRFIGLKSRGVYETPGGTVLFIAHQDLELICLDREVLRIKRHLAERMSDYVYNGFWFSPECEYIRTCLAVSQNDVCGSVDLKLFKGSVKVLGRRSPQTLYNQSLVSMDDHGGFEPANSTGFIRIQALRLQEYYNKHRQLL